MGEVESESLSLKELSFLRPLNLSISATEQGKVDASLLKTWSSKWHGSNELFLASPPFKKKIRQLPTNPYVLSLIFILLSKSNLIGIPILEHNLLLSKK